MRCEHLQDSGSYVLGALSPPERDAYERHLGQCDTCRTEVADLAVLPGLLGRLDLPTARAIAAGGEGAMHAVVDGMPGIDVQKLWAGPTGWAGPTAWSGPSGWAGPTAVPPGRDEKTSPLLARVLDRARAERRSERRRRRWRATGAVFMAACLGVVAVLGVRAAGIGAPPTHHFAGMHQVVAGAPVTAKVALESFSGGTRVHMQCSYQSGEGEGEWTFQLFAVPKMGAAQQISSWTAGYGDNYQLDGHTAIKLTELKRIELRRNDGAPLLVYEVPA
jgi:hypothetical protein